MQPAVEPRLALAVCGAHLTGQPLNHQLTEIGATLEAATLTAPHYRCFLLATTPAKPGLVRVAEGGVALEVEVWLLPESQVGRFIAQVSAPLCIGQLELASGRWVHGFLCEGHASAGAREISEFGSWRAFLATLHSEHA